MKIYYTIKAHNLMADWMEVPDSYDPADTADRYRQYLIEELQTVFPHADHAISIKMVLGADSKPLFVYDESDSYSDDELLFQYAADRAYDRLCKSFDFQL